VVCIPVVVSTSTKEEPATVNVLVGNRAIVEVGMNCVMMMRDDDAVFELDASMSAVNELDAARGEVDKSKLEFS
jgi:hypothetical protein